MRRILKSSCAWSALTLVAVTSLSAARAADPAPADAPAATGVEEIVISADRRAERLRDVPATVTTVTGEKLEKETITTLRDVVEHSPSISYQQTGDTRTDTLSIRGISSVGNVAGVEPDAAIVIDGETLARTMQMNYNTVDINRVEILEGPQGTLFGKNAVAGIINVVTKGPKLAEGPSGDVHVDIAEDNEYRVKGSVNIPLTPSSALYANLFYQYQGGWEKNANPDQPNGGQQQGLGGRLQYLYQPTEDFSILARGEYSQRHTGIIPYAFKELSEADVVNASKAIAGNTSMVPQFNALLAASGINLVTAGGVSTPIVNGTTSYLSDDRDWGHDHTFAGSLQVRKDFDVGSLIYQGSYRLFSLYSNDNEWGISAPQLTNSPYGLDTLDYAGPTMETTVQQEIRLESPADSRLKYVAGAFYYYNRNYHQEIYKTCNDAVYGYYNGSGYPNPNPINPVKGFNCTGGYSGKYSVNDFTTTTHTNNEALFANIDYPIWGGLEAFAGARMLWEQQDMSLQHLPDDNTAAYFFSKTDPYGVLTGNNSQHALIHRVGAKYDFGPVMFYLTESDGFKGVSWDNYNLVSKTVSAQPLAPERPQQVEAGMRGDLFDKRLDWAASAFRIHDKNYQARVIWYQPGAISNRVIDAGTTRNEGVEAGLNAWLYKGLKVGGAWTWLRSDFLDSVLLPQRGGSFIDLKGYALPNAPRYSYSAYVDYNFDFPTPEFNSDIRFEMRHRGLQNSTVNPDVNEQVGAYQILDGYYTLASGDGKWDTTLYVKNILNRLYYDRPFEPAVLGWTYGQMAALPRDYTRYFGMNFTLHFQ